MAAGYLLDTNVISEIRKREPDPGVERWFSAASQSELFLSVLVIGELRQIPVSLSVAEEWGRMNAGNPLPTVDGLLAATARVHDLTLVTRATRDVARTRVSLLNPFTG